MMISRRFSEHITMKFCLKLKFNFQIKSVLSPWITKEILKSFKRIQHLYEKLLKRETTHCKEYKNLFETNKVACVVKIKLAFMEWIFYSLVILIKLYKIRCLNLDKALLFLRNQAICLKNWKLWRSLSTTKFNISRWNFAHVFYLTSLQKDVLDFFCFV